jgi:Ser/Thr protein kinase RdoA (MazF antagonist)
MHCGYCSAFILEFVMNDVVERILNAYQSICPVDAQRAVELPTLAVIWCHTSMIAYAATLSACVTRSVLRLRD